MQRSLANTVMFFASSGSLSDTLICMIRVSFGFSIVIQYLMNDTILKEDDIEKYLGINTLAQLPLVKGTSKRTKKVKRAR